MHARMCVLKFRSGEQQLQAARYPGGDNQGRGRACGAHVAAAEEVGSRVEEEEEVPEDEEAVREVCRRLHAEKRALVRVQAFGCLLKGCVRVRVRARVRVRVRVRVYMRACTRCVLNYADAGASDACVCCTLAGVPVFVVGLFSHINRSLLPQTLASFDTRVPVTLVPAGARSSVKRLLWDANYPR